MSSVDSFAKIVDTNAFLLTESFTPDGSPLMGPNPDIGGLYHSHAYNSGGVMLSGGSGRMLAQWIIDGEPELDMFAYDIR